LGNWRKNFCNGEATDADTPGQPGIAIVPIGTLVFPIGKRELMVSLRGSCVLAHDDSAVELLQE
jgi:hypothetical protein